MGNKAPTSVSQGGVGKGALEALIRDVIKGQLLLGIGGCFIATGWFLTSLQMSSVGTGVSTLSLLWGELNCCAGS